MTGKSRSNQLRETSGASAGDSETQEYSQSFLKAKYEEFINDPKVQESIKRADEDIKHGRKL